MRSHIAKGYTNNVEYDRDRDKGLVALNLHSNHFDGSDGHVYPCETVFHFRYNHVKLMDICIGYMLDLDNKEHIEN